MLNACSISSGDDAIDRQRKAHHVAKSTGWDLNPGSTTVQLCDRGEFH